MNEDEIPHYTSVDQILTKDHELQPDPKGTISHVNLFFKPGGDWELFHNKVDKTLGTRWGGSMYWWEGQPAKPPVVLFMFQHGGEKTPPVEFIIDYEVFKEVVQLLAKARGL